MGAQTLEIPRGRILDVDGSCREFRSEALPRYARRTREVDEAILGAYLAGANTCRIRKALAPLLGEEHLSKSAVSRVASRLKEMFRHWSERDVSQERYAILFRDGFHLKVRMARRGVSVPLLAVLGVPRTVASIWSRSGWPRARPAATGRARSRICSVGVSRLRR